MFLIQNEHVKIGFSEPQHVFYNSFSFLAGKLLKPSPSKPRTEVVFVTPKPEREYAPY